jgi:TonB family protein
MVSHRIFAHVATCRTPFLGFLKLLLQSIIIIALLFAGCSTSAEIQTTADLPELMFQTPLPPLPDQFFMPGDKLDALFHIESDGTVAEVHLVTPTGTKAWDTLASGEMKKWRFIPARVGGKRVQMWIRLPLRLRWMETALVDLSELICSDRSKADSAYALMINGRDFEDLVNQFSIADSKKAHGRIGEVDIRSYPERIRNRLLKLDENEFTEPISVGDTFVIYKRASRSRKSDHGPTSDLIKEGMVGLRRQNAVD